MSSKPSTPILQRRYAENEFSRIPVVSRSPIPFHRTYSMRLRSNCLLNQLNESTLKQHNKNFAHLKSTSAAAGDQRQSKLNLQRQRRSSFSMESKSEANNIDTGGGCNGDVARDEVDHSVGETKLMNGDLRRSSFSKNHDRGMVSVNNF